MGIWVEILKLGGAGEYTIARKMLALNLPFSLRDFAPSSASQRQYHGVLPRAVRRFAMTLPTNEKGLLQSCESDFIDTLLTDVCEEVERTLLLVELCQREPQLTIEQLQQVFPWSQGLKRSEGWKRARLLGYLRSFQAVGVYLPPDLCRTVAAAAEQEVPVFLFDEIAYAVSGRRMEQSWKDFKEEMEWSDRFVGIITGEEDTSSFAECLDYSSIVSTRWLVNPIDEDAEHKVEWLLLGREVSPDLMALLDSLHANSPTDGYRPIAWHNVFWNLSSNYESLPLALELRSPFQETDQELADHIVSHYTEVKSASRPVISRRRKKLYDICAERIIHRLREYFVPAEKNVIEVNKTKSESHLPLSEEQ